MESIDLYLGVRKGRYSRADDIRTALDRFPSVSTRADHTSAIQLLDSVRKELAVAERCLVVLEAPARSDLGTPVDHCILNMRGQTQRCYGPEAEVDIVVVVDSRHSNAYTRQGVYSAEGPSKLTRAVLSHGAWAISVDQHTGVDELYAAFSGILDGSHELRDLCAFGQTPLVGARALPAKGRWDWRSIFMRPKAA